MKRFLSLILSLTSLFIIFLSVYSCAKNDNIKSDSTSDGTNQTVTTTEDLNCYAAPQTTYYDKYQSDSFVDYWKKQQNSNDPKTIAWRALDGSAETSLLFPKVIKDEYQFSCCELGGDNWYFHEKHTIFGEHRDCSNMFMTYTYNFTWGDDYWTEATMIIKVIKGNPVNDLFKKDELTYEDLKYFVDTFEYTGILKDRFDKIEYFDDMIVMRNEYRVHVYFLHLGRIVHVETTDDDLVASPEQIFDYLVFEEITVE